MVILFSHQFHIFPAVVGVLALATPTTNKVEQCIFWWFFIFGLLRNIRKQKPFGCWCGVCYELVVGVANARTPTTAEIYPILPNKCSVPVCLAILSTVSCTERIESNTLPIIDSVVCVLIFAQKSFQNVCF